jgi:4-hydroxy-3-methylbut-2-en-1-yl diphosphate synthase IspG/GcpE
MSLTACPDCGASVSNRSPSCVRCGRPMAAQTIEATAKVWKGLQLASGLLLVISFVGCLVTGPGLLTESTFVLGFIVFVGARISAWWENG